MVSYIDNLQLPQVLYTLQCSVTTWQKVGQIFMQAKAVQPGGKGCAAITAQCLYLHWRERHVKETAPVALGCSDKIRMRTQDNLKCVCFEFSNCDKNILTHKGKCWTGATVRGLEFRCKSCAYFAPHCQPFLKILSTTSKKKSTYCSGRWPCCFFKKYRGKLCVWEACASCMCRQWALILSVYIVAHLSGVIEILSTLFRVLMLIFNE